MFRGRLFLLPLLAVLTVLGACQSEGKLTGEVFIVTEGRENVEMGLVDVKAIEAESVEKHLQRRYKRARRRVKSQASDMATLLDSLSRLSAQLSEATATGPLRSYALDETSRVSAGEKVVAIPDAEEIVLRGTRKGTVRLTEPTVGTAVNRLGDKYVFYKVDFGSFSGQVNNSNMVRYRDFQSVNRNRKIEERIETEIDYMSTSIEEGISLISKIRVERYYWDGFPQEKDSDETGSDGEYELTVDGGVPYYLVAQASRSVGDEEEQYYWMVKATVEGGEEKEVNLSNDNLGGVANRKYALSERTFSVAREIWESTIRMAKQGEELEWEKLIYRTAFPDDTTGVPIPDDLDVPEEKMLSNR
jgi:hypothetical protein